MRALKQEPADFALGSRRLGQSRNMPFARRVFLFAATLFTVATTGLCLTDTHNGLRAFTRRGASALSFRQNRMAHASEILTDIANSGLRYIEVPVTVDYTCPFRKSYPDVLVMQSSQYRNGDNGARSLDGSMQRRIFL
jgi:hypothetical protein